MSNGYTSNDLNMATVQKGLSFIQTFPDLTPAKQLTAQAIKTNNENTIAKIDASSKAKNNLIAIPTTKQATKQGSLIYRILDIFAYGTTSSQAVTTTNKDVLNKPIIASQTGKVIVSNAFNKGLNKVNTNVKC